VSVSKKRIGFLSFGHWSDSHGSQVRSASDALLQSMDLAVAAEALGADGAYFRVHHFAQQLGSPFPLLAAVGARTSRIEIGTAVIDMRYENPHYMAEDAGAADLIAKGRLQLGISRGSPEQVIDYVAHIDPTTRAIFGRSYAADPATLVKQLAGDEAVAAADTLLLTVPNQLGVEYNAHVIESTLKYVAPELGWR
jgi:alkanesulfonate monooxygenase SsuD/methylene tetrahydromethanopterin reductase-like flavin-dependent oxidoreductase (luciferase family)